MVSSYSRLMDADAGAGAKLEAFHELKKLGIFFEDAENFVGAGDLRVGQPHRAEFAPQLGHAAEAAERRAGSGRRGQSVSAAAPATCGEMPCSRRSASSCARDQSMPMTSVRSFSARRWRRTKMLGDSLPFRGKDDAAVSPDVQVTGPGHAFEGGGDGGRRDAEVFRQARADRRLLFLHELPDSF